MILKLFDPWKNPRCTCPSKLSLNPYTGCSHGCLYCYASSYIPRFYECRPKKDLFRQLGRDVSRIEPGTLVAVSSSSDPYQPMEKDLRLTRGCLQILKDKGMRVLVMTKSDLVCRDANILSEMMSAVSITITTMSDSLAARLEPFAPLPSRRLEAIKLLCDSGVPVSARIDPVIPGINDSEVSDLVSAVCNAGAEHIISSTYKSRPDSLKRLCFAFPEAAESLRASLNKGEHFGGSHYLPRDMRQSIMLEVASAAAKEGVTFAACREGLQQMPGISCDGSHLILWDANAIATTFREPLAMKVYIYKE